MRILFAAVVAASAGMAISFSPLEAQAQSVPGIGPYVGLNAGLAWGDSQQRDQVILPAPVLPPPPADGNYDVDGASFGIGAG